jgi:hypothetical protein
MIWLCNSDISTVAVMRLTIKRQTEYEQRLDNEPVRADCDLFASGYIVTTFI